MGAKVTINTSEGVDLDIYGEYTPEEPEVLHGDGTGTPKISADFEIQEAWYGDKRVTGLIDYLNHIIKRDDIWVSLTEKAFEEYEKGRS